MPPATSTREHAVPSGARFRIRKGGREIAVPRAGLLVGRSGECAIRLEGGLVSRKHARVYTTEAGLVVEDLGSRNGVLVNDRKLAEPAVLAHGDVIAIGNERLEVVDAHVLSHPEHLSTLPPPPTGVAPPGEADVDAQPVTVTARLDVLTEREREVLQLIVLGYTHREIAEKLFVSVKTVETHRAHIADKLECRTRAELVTYAISAGLMSGILRAR